MKKYFFIPIMLLSIHELHAQGANDFIAPDILNPPTEIQEDRLRQYTEAEAENASNRLEATQNLNNSIGAALGHVNTLMGIYHSAQGLYQAARALGSGECAPDFSTSADAMMSINCKRNEECEQCYASAVNELNFVRRQLGRLGCIYQNTKNFTNSAIAFGDNASGIHAVTGLAWQSSRAEIIATLNHFKQTYDNKYRDMVGALERALRSIDACENQFGQEGWFQRSGFIYLEFLKDKYRRND